MPPFFQNQNSPDYQAGIDEGFRIAESYLKIASKKFYKEIKKGLFRGLATTSSTFIHKCNCEFCELSSKD